MTAGAGAVRAGRAFIEMFIEDKDFKAELNNLEARVVDFGKTLQSAGMEIATIGAAVTAPFAISAKIFADFSDEMQTVKAITGATGEAFEMLNDQAKQLGATTSFTASEVSQGMIALARAGFQVQEIYDAIPDVLNLSRATATELGEAADIAAVNVRAFGLEAQDTSRVVDVLVATANNSAQTLVDLAEGFKLVAPVAADMGTEIEDVAAGLGVLANAGLKGSIASTGLRRAFLNLAQSSTRLKLKEKFDFEVKDIRDISGVIRDLNARLDELGATDLERLAAFEDVFGRGVTAARILAANSDKIKEFDADLDAAAGTAARTAAIMDEQLGGSFRRFNSAAEAVAIAVGEAIEPALISITETLAKALRAVSRFISENQTLVTVIGVVGAALTVFGAAIAALGTLTVILPTLVAGFVALKAAIIPLIGFAGFVAIWTGAFKALSFAIEAVIPGLREANQFAAEMNKRAQELDQEFLKLAKDNPFTRDEAAQNAKAFAEELKKAGVNQEELVAALKEQARLERDRAKRVRTASPDSAFSIESRAIRSDRLDKLSRALANEAKLLEGAAKDQVRIDKEALDKIEQNRERFEQRQQQRQERRGAALEQREFRQQIETDPGAALAGAQEGLTNALEELAERQEKAADLFRRAIEENDASLGSIAQAEINEIARVQDAIDKFTGQVNRAEDALTAQAEAEQRAAEQAFKRAQQEVERQREQEQQTRMRTREDAEGALEDFNEDLRDRERQDAEAAEAEAFGQLVEDDPAAALKQANAALAQAQKAAAMAAREAQDSFRQAVATGEAADLEAAEALARAANQLADEEDRQEDFVQQAKDALDDVAREVEVTAGLGTFSAAEISGLFGTGGDPGERLQKEQRDIQKDIQDNTKVAADALVNLNLGLV